MWGHCDGTAEKERVAELMARAVRRALTFGRNFEANGMFDKAKKVYEEAIARYPDAPGIEEVKDRLAALRDELAVGEVADEQEYGCQPFCRLARKGS